MGSGEAASFWFVLTDMWHGEAATHRRHQTCSRRLCEQPPVTPRPATRSPDDLPARTSPRHEAAHPSPGSAGADARRGSRTAPKEASGRGARLSAGECASLLIDWRRSFPIPRGSGRRPEGACWWASSRWLERGLGGQTSSGLFGQAQIDQPLHGRPVVGEDLAAGQSRGYAAGGGGHHGGEVGRQRGRGSLEPSGRVC